LLRYLKKIFYNSVAELRIKNFIFLRPDKEEVYKNFKYFEKY
jgi:hypothetical protein